MATLDAADLIFAVAIPRGGDGRADEREGERGECVLFFYKR